MKAKKTPASYKPVAIIGASCRFPGEARGLDQYWSLLASGKDAVTSLPEDRFSLERYISASQKLDGHSYIAAAGVLSRVKDFDAQFFGISRKEAQYMDPQQRLALEAAWEALEQASLLPSSLRGTNTGVFMGASNVDHTLQGPDDPCTMSPYSMTGSTLSIIANRISYYLDLHGPSFTVDTACSSSLTAIHQACIALHSGETSLAIAGGVNVLTAPFPFIGFSKARMLSPTGRCKVFDASGDGYVRAEGVGAVVLKPLDAALKDGNEILAVIVGSGVNSDGRTTGISLPNQAAQAALLEDIYSGFKLDKEKLVYVEAHGTGTAAGDPIEAGAIGAVLGKSLAGRRKLPVGSAKSNIGHLESASGMAGLIKALLVLKHGKIPPNLHLHNPNPAIDFKELNLTVPTKLTPLPKAGGGELIGINSFGFGGTNAHIVLQAPPKAKSKRLPAKRGTKTPPLFLAARSEASLKGMAEQYLTALDGITPPAYYDLAATTVFHKESMPYRSVITGATLDDIAAGLKKLLRSESSHAPHIAHELAHNAGAGLFAFSGNGSQWTGMGAALIRENSDFAAAVRAVDVLLAPLQGWSCEELLTEHEKHADSFELTEFNQPLLFTVQVALVEALKARGIAPSGVAGHSVGEVAAAWASGALSLADAVTVIHHRSRLQGKLRDKGSMAVAEMSAEKAAPLLALFSGAIEITAVNTESSITVAGPTATLKSFVDQCKAKRISAKMLSIAYPFHTAAMDDIKEELIGALAKIKPVKPKIPFYSTVYGKSTTTALDAKYWWNNLRKPVLFAPAVKSAFAGGIRRFLEIGPSPVLRSYLRKLLDTGSESVWISPTLLKGKNEAQEFDNAWKHAWRQGWRMNMRVHFPHSFARAALPLYPWDKEFLWSEDTPENRGFLKAKRTHPLLGWPLPGNPAIFENTVQPADYPWLGDHIAGNGPIYPAAAFLESMLAAAAALPMEGQIELERVSIFRPLPLSDDAPKAIRIAVDKEDGGITVEGRTFMSAEPWSGYAKGRVVLQADTPVDSDMSVTSPESFGVLVDKEVLYKTAGRFLLHYGPAFQSVSKAWVRSGASSEEVLARLSAPVAESAEGMLVPPTLTDGALQTLFILLGAKSAASNSAYLPVFFDRIILYSPGVPQFVHAKLERTSPRSVVASFRLLSATGKTLLYLKNCRFRRAVWLEQENVPSEPYVVELTPSPRPDAIRPLAAVAPGSLAKEVERALSGPASQHGGTDVPQGMHSYLLLQLAALSAVHESILSLCGGPEKELNCSCHDLVEAGVLDASQETWFNHMMERLEVAGLASHEGERWNVQPRGERPSAEALWRTVMGTSPGFLPENMLLSHVFKRHEAILGGKFVDRENDILSPRLIDNYYLNSLALQPFAEAAKRCVAAVLRAGKSDQLINILQISGNSTGLVTDVLPLLDKRACRYVVAEKDASTAEARALAFGNVPGLQFCALNPAEPDETHASRYHLIILAWSMHQYLDNAAVLENCRAMLAPGGVLCLLEHSPTVFADYVFGARPSWWAASPAVHSPVSLLSERQYWQKLLSDTGFAEVPLSLDTEGDHRPAFILLAQKKQALAAKTSAPAESADTAALPATRFLLVANDASTDSGLTAKAMKPLLEQHGVSPQIVHHGQACDITTPDTWKKLLSKFAFGKNHPPLHIVYLAAYDTRDDLSLTQLESVQFTGTAGLMALTKTWDEARPDIRITVIAGGALADGVPTARPVPSQGAVAGFTRVLMNEQRGLETRFIDLHGTVAGAKKMLPDLVRELLVPEDEPEIMLADGIRFAPRLARLAPRPGPAGAEENQGATLAFDMPGRLQNLYWKQTPVPKPGKDEVCIEVKYTGLNYRDVLWSMGMLLDEALENGFSGPTMGIECSGVITAVGKDVKGWVPGDPVLCFSPAGFGTHVVTNASAIARKPDNISFAEAASIPVAFITAWYSIKHMARMQPGERILIHGAAGGVGLAAIQIAAHLGLEVYATAGAPEKQNFLRQLGIKHIYSSRSLAFAKQIMDQTGGSGVDAVLNSLAGEAIPAGLSVLRPFGRFLELGKRDFYADTPMRLRPFSNNISYYGVDVDQLLVYQPALARQLFAELMELFVQRRLAPLPQTVYPVTKTLTAFQTMQQSSHIGKIVVSMDGASALAQPSAQALDKLELTADATYLVSGGAGGLGLASAARLARRGARNLLLLGRSGVKDEESQKIVDGMLAAGVKAVIVKTDVGDPKKLGAALKKHLKDMPPLKGVIHAAAVLDDGVVTSLTPKRLQTSLYAKSLGAYALHEATLDCKLDFFVLYSSVAAAFGNPGQAGYVAANCMLESLAAWRKSKNLPAQVIGWGAIDDTGMITRNEKVKQALLKVLGVSATQSSSALYWLEHCIKSNVSSSYFFGVDWHTRANIPILEAPRFSRLRPRSAGRQDADRLPLEKLRTCGQKEAIELITGMLIDEICHVLRMPKDRLTPDTPLIAQGMDSLMAVELSLAVEQKFEITGYTLPLSDTTTAVSLAESLYSVITGAGAEQTVPEGQELDIFAHKHGFELSEEQKGEVLQSLQKDTHERR